MIALVCIGGLVALVILSSVRHVYRLRKHGGWKRGDFIAHFESGGVSASVSGAVYDHFQDMGVWKRFSPAPLDSIENTYKAVDEDVTDSLQQILDRLGCEMPNSRKLKQWERPIETVLDVVELVDWVKKGETGTGQTDAFPPAKR